MMDSFGYESNFSNTTNRAIEVRVVRYHVKRFCSARDLVPVALGAGVLARHMLNTIVPYIVLSLYAALLLYMLSAIRWLGRKSLRIDGSTVVLGEEIVIPARHVTSWAHDRELARVYGDERSYSLSANADDAYTLKAHLTTILGKPRPLQPFGSLLARRIVLTLALAGLLLTTYGIACRSHPSIIVGAVIAMFATIAYITLKRRVARL